MLTSLFGTAADSVYESVTSGYNKAVQNRIASELPGTNVAGVAEYHCHMHEKQTHTHIMCHKHKKQP